MPRKKRNQADAAIEQPVTTETTTVATAEPDLAPTPVERPAWVDGPPTPVNGQTTVSSEAAHGKHWGDPYKSIFTCREMGFELGENRRFRQRVFRFSLKPSDEILASLKENGFTYRASEKSWTVTANADTRKLTDELAREWAGPNYIKSIER